MKTGRQWTRYIGPVLGLGLFIAAVFVLRQMLKEYPPSAILKEIHSLSSKRLLLAGALMVLSYFVLSLYDVLALRHLGIKLPFRRAAFAGFVGFAFSNSVGYSTLSGGAVRYRFYSGWGLSGLDTTLVILFNGVTLGLGACTLAGICLLFDPVGLPQLARLGQHANQIAGGLALTVAPVYLGACLLFRRPIRLRGLCFTAPKFKIGAQQTLLACIDLSLAAAVLYFLIPHSDRLPFSQFLSAFVLAIVAGIISQLPGGLGVFETALFMLLPDTVSKSAVLGGLVAYRGVYHLVPLATAAALLGGHELLARFFWSSPRE